MNRTYGMAITALLLITGLTVPLRSQQPSTEKSDLIDPDAAEALNTWGPICAASKIFR